MKRSVNRTFALVFVLVVTSIWCLGACSSVHGGFGVKERLRKSRDDVRAGIKHLGGAAKSEHGRIFAALAAADEASLKTPILCDARFYPDYDSRQSMLVVTWIGDSPAGVVAVRLTWQDGRSKDFPLTSEIVDDNRRAAKEGVVYVASFPFLHRSREEEELLTHHQPWATLMGESTALTTDQPVVYVSHSKESDWETAEIGVAKSHGPGEPRNGD